MAELLEPEWRARAEVFVPTVMKAHPEIVSIDALWETTRDTPLYVPRTYFREAARATVTEEAQLKLIASLRDDELIPRRWHREGYQKIRGSYRYVVETTGFDLERGEIITRRGAFDTDSQLAPWDVFDQADYFGIESGPLGMAPGFTMSIVHAFHRSGAGW